jgi:hypothetical protein
MDSIRSMFSQLDPVFFQIFQMLNGTTDLNIIQRVDPILYLNGLINPALIISDKLNEINGTIANFTVF